MTVATVRTRWGAALTRPNDAYIGRSLAQYREYSAGEQKFFASVLRAGDVAVDVGANIGAHTLCLASLVGPRGRVYAYEPQRVPFQMLCGTLALNDLRNVYAYNAPVGAVPGTVVPIPEVDMDLACNCGGLSLVERAEGGTPLAMVCLDDYDMPGCRLLKVDVEGMERDVLLGAGRLVKRYAPVVYVEANHEPEAYALRDMLEPAGYRCFMHFVPLFNPHNYAGNTRNVWAGREQSMNLVALPPWWDAPVPPKFRPVTDANRSRLFDEGGWN